MSLEPAYMKLMAARGPFSDRILTPIASAFSRMIRSVAAQRMS